MNMLTTAPQDEIYQCRIAYILDQRLPVRKANTEQVMNTISALAAEGLNIKLIIPTKWRDLVMPKPIFMQRLIDYYQIQNGFSLAGLVHLPFSPFKLVKISHGLLAPIYASISKYDIIYTRNSLPAMVALALGKKVVFEVYRIYDHEKADVAKHLARRTNSSNSISIITHSIPSKESLLQTGAAEEKIKVIPNGFNSALFVPRLTKGEARERLGWGRQEKIACFAGRIDVAKGANTILKLAERTPEIKYVLLGYSEDDSNEWIFKAAEQKGLKNIQRLPWVSSEKLPQYLFASDVLIIPPTAGPLMQHRNTVLPIKTFIYMAAGRCILAPLLPDTEGVLNESNAALVQPDNIDIAEKTIRRLFEDNVWADSIAKQAYLDSKNFTWQNRAKKIIEFLKEQLL